MRIAAGPNRRVLGGRPITISNFGQASPPPNERFVTISSGAYHTCALRQDGAAVCWGARMSNTHPLRENSFGQSEPPAGEVFTAISCGDLHTCALRPDGTPVCWGKGFPDTP